MTLVHFLQPWKSHGLVLTFSFLKRIFGFKENFVPATFEVRILKAECIHLHATSNWFLIHGGWEQVPSLYFIKSEANACEYTNHKGEQNPCIERLRRQYETETCKSHFIKCTVQESRMFRHRGQLPTACPTPLYCMSNSLAFWVHNQIDLTELRNVQTVFWQCPLPSTMIWYRV